uniref:Odorant-binding protein 2 n=1 Tax=Riptortus pedestris TaxID=329032 RepID=A0A2Z4HQ29_RIPPE|nr:odorant-binding protein 2 [Riptortus pedestris]
MSYVSSIQSAMGILSDNTYVLGILIVVAYKVLAEDSDIPKECRNVLSLETEEKCCPIPYGQMSEKELAYMTECTAMPRKGLPSTDAPEESSSEESSEEENINIEDEECIDECFFNKTGLLTLEGKLNEEVVRKDFLEDFNSEPWKPVAEEAITKCLVKAPSAVKEGAKCRSGSYQILLCVLSEIYKNCPPGVWLDSSACKKDKALTEKCVEYVIR